MKIRHGIKLVAFPVINNHVHVVRTTNIRQSVELIKETRDQLSPDFCFRGVRGLTLVTENDEIYIFVPWKRSSGTDAHEAYHAVRHLLGQQGIEMENEVVAYHLGYLVEAMQIDKPTRKQLTKRNKKSKVLK